jgi:hypothetical protein
MWRPKLQVLGRPAYIIRNNTYSVVNHKLTPNLWRRPALRHLGRTLNFMSCTVSFNSHIQSWPTTRLKPDGGAECTGIFRSCTEFEVDNATEVSFQCRHPPWVVPIRSCEIRQRPASRDTPAPQYFNYSWVGLKFQLVYCADLHKRRKSHGTQYTLQPPSLYDHEFRCVPVYFG